MRTSRRAVALGLLSCAGAFPAGARAQGLRIAVEPVVGALPAGTLWNSSRSVAVIASSPDDRYPDVPETPATHAHTVRLSRDAMPVYGGRLTLAPPGGAWRLELGGAAGSGTLRARVSDRIAADDGVTPLFDSGARFQSGDLPLALAQVGVHVERALRPRRAVAIEIGAGAMAQRVHTRTQVAYDGPSTGGSTIVVQQRYRSVTDPGLQASVAAGPATGALAGLRFAFRSTHVLRAPRLANEYRNMNYAMDYPRRFRRWQWQPELSLGWRLPVLGRDPTTR
jgi:hypothetical protein